MKPGIVDRVLSRAAELSISKADLARRIAVSPQSITTWVTSGSINIRHLVPLSRVLGVRVAWLLEGDNAASQAMDEVLLAQVVGSIRRSEDALAKRIDPDRVGKLAAILYEEGLKSGGVDDRQVDKLLRLII